jgi:hypothetical protein
VRDGAAGPRWEHLSHAGARAVSRDASHPALPNETLQLTGASAEVVVVAARLVDTLSQLHLSSGHAARS